MKKPTLPFGTSMSRSRLVRYMSPLGFAQVNVWLYGPAVSVCWLTPDLSASMARLTMLHDTTLRASTLATRPRVYESMTTAASSSSTSARFSSEGSRSLQRAERSSTVAYAVAMRRPP